MTCDEYRLLEDHVWYRYTSDVMNPQPPRATASPSKQKSFLHGGLLYFQSEEWSSLVPFGLKTKQGWGMGD